MLNIHRFAELTDADCLKFKAYIEAYLMIAECERITVELIEPYDAMETKMH